MVCTDQSIQDGREYTVTNESEDTSVMMESPLCLYSKQVKAPSREELNAPARDSVKLTMSDVRNWGPRHFMNVSTSIEKKHDRKLSTSLEKGARKVLGLSATKVKCLLKFFVPRCVAWTKSAADPRTTIVTARWSTLIRNLDRALWGTPRILKLSQLRRPGSLLEHNYSLS